MTQSYNGRRRAVLYFHRELDDSWIPHIYKDIWENPTIGVASEKLAVAVINLLRGKTPLLAMYLKLYLHSALYLSEEVEL